MFFHVLLPTPTSHKNSSQVVQDFLHLQPFQASLVDPTGETITSVTDTNP